MANLRCQKKKNLPNCSKACILGFKPPESNNLPWKSSLKKIFEPFLTKCAGTLMTILAVGTLLVAKATVTRVRTKKAARADRNLEVWRRELLKS